MKGARDFPPKYVTNAKYMGEIIVVYFD